MRRTLWMGVALAAFAAMPVAASAQEAEAQKPKPTVSKEFENWTVRCFENQGVQRCKMSELLVNKKTGRQVLGISFQYFPDKKQSLLEVGVPLGMALQNGAAIVTDTYKSGTMRFTICYPQGCYVGTVVDEGTVAQFGKATKGSIDVVLFATGKKLSIPFQVAGFTAAYRTMVENTHGKPVETAAAPAQ